MRHDHDPAPSCRHRERLSLRERETRSLDNNLTAVGFQRSEAVDGIEGSGIDRLGSQLPGEFETIGRNIRREHTLDAKREPYRDGSKSDRSAAHNCERSSGAFTGTKQSMSRGSKQIEQRGGPFKADRGSNGKKAVGTYRYVLR
jgi:hypothetical protein